MDIVSSMVKGFSTALVGMLAFFSTVAHADNVQDFVQARELYQSRRFDDAIAILEQLVGTEPPKVKDEILELDCRKYLGASYIFVGKQADGRLQFRKLLKKELDYVLDRSAFPRAVLSTFEDVRKSLLAEVETERAIARLRKENSQLETNLAETTKALEVEKTRTARVQLSKKNSRWVALLPFGVGQFQNGDALSGWLFLTTQIALAATSVGLFIAHSVVRELSIQPIVGRPPGAENGTDSGLPRTEEQIRYTELEERLRVANWIAFGAFLVTAIAGVLHSQIMFVPEIAIAGPSERIGARFVMTF